MDMPESVRVELMWRKNFIGFSSFLAFMYTLGSCMGGIIMWVDMARVGVGRGVRSWFNNSFV